MHQGIFVIGGCVVRDAYELVKEDYPLTGYVARQSLISAMNRPTTVLPQAQLASKFQTRNLNGDLASNLLPTLEKVAPTTGLFLMDLNVERLGVHKLSDGSFVTRSGELKASGILETVPDLGGSIRIGTDRHTQFWTYAAANFARKVEALGIKDRFLVVNTPWATRSTDGTRLPTFAGRPLRDVSADIGSLARMLDRHGLHVVDLPRALSITSPQHKWGPAPYHFDQPAMRWIAGQIRAALPAPTKRLMGRLLPGVRRS
jgi:hypothetical protein